MAIKARTAQFKAENVSGNCAAVVDADGDELSVTVYHGAFDGDLRFSVSASRWRTELRDLLVKTLDEAALEASRLEKAVQ